MIHSENSPVLTLCHRTSDVRCTPWALETYVTMLCAGISIVLPIATGRCRWRDWLADVMYCVMVCAASPGILNFTFSAEGFRLIATTTTWPVAGSLYADTS